MPAGHQVDQLVAFQQRRALLERHVAAEPARVSRHGVLLGAVGSSLALGHRGAFTAGAMTASLLWFSCLGLLARRFSPVLARPGVWRAVETFTGLMMLVLAGMVVRG